MADPIREEIDREVAANKILVYGKGTKQQPRCGFTLETVEFFKRLGYPFAVIDVLENVPKRSALSEMTDWPTLAKGLHRRKVLRRHRHLGADGPTGRVAADPRGDVRWRASGDGRQTALSAKRGLLELFASERARPRGSPRSASPRRCARGCTRSTRSGTSATSRIRPISSSAACSCLRRSAIPSRDRFRSST